MNKLTIYTIISPDDINMPIMWRWKIETCNSIICQKNPFDNLRDCILSYKAWIRHHWPKLTYHIEYKTVSNIEFII